jgi:hypothetical protein
MEFVDETFRTMSVGPIAATAIQATTYRAGTILYAGPEQSRPISTVTTGIDAYY